MATDTARGVLLSQGDGETMTAQEILQAALADFHPRVALATSFAAEGMVLIDMLMQIELRARIFTLDTGRLPAETYSLIDTVRERYGCSIEVYVPESAPVEAMVRAHGVNLFYESVELRKHCCAVRKIAPLRRALGGLEAWITGLRREQAVTRTRIAKIEVDAEHGGILKINPLANWTAADVWRYIRERRVPYNALHDRGYPSIGCAPCTRAVPPGEDERSGRWWWETSATKECGLHVALHANDTISPGG